LGRGRGSDGVEEGTYLWRGERAKKPSHDCVESRAVKCPFGQKGEPEHGMGTGK